MTAQEYNRYIYENFVEKNIELFESCHSAAKKKKISFMDDLESQKLLQILDSISQKYDFDMRRTFQINYEQFWLFQNSFGMSHSKKAILIATEFVLFCCLADKILDSPRFSKHEKEAVCNKLQLEIAVSNSCDDPFPELTVLHQDIIEFLNDYELDYMEKVQKIRGKVTLAFDSEKYMYYNDLRNMCSIKSENVHKLIDKSVEFESAAFLISTIFNNTDSIEKAVAEIANIYWLIDDICDFAEDVQCKRANSILFICAPPEQSLNLEMRIEITLRNIKELLRKLENSMQSLSRLVNEDVYCFVIKQVWEWCKNVRKMEE